MQLKKIAIITDMFIVGGVEKVIVDAVTFLSKTYDISIVVLFDEPAPTLASELPDNVHVKTCHLSRSSLLMLLLSLPILGGIILDNLLGGTKYDYLISCKPITLMASYCRSAANKIYWSHLDKDVMYADKQKLNWFRKINKIRLYLGYIKYNSIWALSPEMGNALKKAFHHRNIKVLPNPINCCQIIEMSNQTDIGFPNTINIVTVGRLSYEKGIDRVINCLGRLPPPKNHYHLYIIGDGPERNHLENLVAHHGLSDNISFLGMLSNPYPYIKNAQLLLCPSRTESFGLVLLEAMLLKTPIITTSTLGAKHVSAQGAYGHLISNSDDALLTAISSFLNNPDMLSGTLESNYIRAQQYDVGVFHERIASLLQKHSL